MTEKYQIVSIEKPEQAHWAAIGGGIGTFNTQQAGDENYQPLCFCFYDPDEEVAGGIIGATFWDWFYLDLLWVKEELRGSGYGRQLVMLAEAEARQRGARHVFLDTFSFQAPDFYKQLGYQVFGELPDFPAGHTRYYLTKAL